MTAPDILRAAIKHMEDRAKTYDKPEGERSMGATVEAFSAVTGVSMTEEQGWLFMALLKAVRSQQGEYRADSYEDGAAYFALAGEAAMRDRVAGKQEDTGAMRFKTVRDWVVWQWNGSWMPENPKLLAVNHVIQSKGKLIIDELGMIGLTPLQGGPLTRCVGCTESNCMC